MQGDILKGRAMSNCVCELQAAATIPCDTWGQDCYNYEEDFVAIQ